MQQYGNHFGENIHVRALKMLLEAMVDFDESAFLKPSDSPPEGTSGGAGLAGDMPGAGENLLIIAIETDHFKDYPALGFGEGIALKKVPHYIVALD